MSKLVRTIGALVFASGVVGVPGVAVHAQAPAAETAVLLDRVRTWYARDRLDMAREALDRLFRVEPNNADGLGILAEIEVRSEQAERAAATLARLRTVSPRHPAIARVETMLRLEGPDREKLREARLLARSGQTKAAIAAFRALYPAGPPGGDLALEFWQLLGDTADGWEAARAGLAQLVKEQPENLRYRFALAEHEASRRPINLTALKTVIDMARLPQYARQAQAAWRRAVMRLDDTPANIPWLQAYVQQAPGDTGARDRLAAMTLAVQERRRLLADPAYQMGKQGLALLEQGDLARAEESLDLSLKQRPNDVEVIGGMGLLRLRQGRHAEAQVLFERALKLDADNASKWTSLARTARFWGVLRDSEEALAAGDPGLAERRARDALRLDARSADAVVALGRAQHAAGRTTEAEQNWREALRLEPTHGGALRALFSVAVQAGTVDAVNRAEARLTVAQRAVIAEEIAAARTRFMREEADRLATAGRNTEAISMLEAATKIDRQDPWLHYDLARQYERTGATARGLGVLDALVSRSAGNVEAVHASALFHMNAGDPVRALSLLEKLPESERTGNIGRLERRVRVRLHATEAAYFARAEQRDDARRSLDAAEQVAAGDPDLLITVALAWIDIAEHARGEKLLATVNAALESSGRTLPVDRVGFVRAELLRAEARRYLQDNRLAEAVTALEQAVAFDADNPWLRFDLARLLLRQGAIDRGRAVMLAQVAKFPTDAESRFALALFQSQAGQVRDALESLERIPAAERTDPMIRTQRRLLVDSLARRAEVLARGRNMNGARQTLAQAERAASGDADLSMTVAWVWAALPDAVRARSLVDPLYARGRASTGWRLRYAGLLQRIGAHEESATVAQAIAAGPALTEEEGAALEELRTTQKLARVEALSRTGDLNAALDTLQTIRASEPTRIRLLFAEGRLLRSSGRNEEALSRYRQVLALDPENTSATLALIDLLVATNQRAEARQRIDRGLHAGPLQRTDDLDTQAALAGALEDLGDIDAARRQLQAVLAVAPAHVDALETMARIERRAGHPDIAIAQVRQSLAANHSRRGLAQSIQPISRIQPAVEGVANVTLNPRSSAVDGLTVEPAPSASVVAESNVGGPYRMLATMLDERASWVSAGLDWRYRSGSSGTSRMDARELPFEWKRPLDANGRTYFRTDLVSVDAGAIDLAASSDARDFGSVLLCQPLCDTGRFVQSDRGVSLTAGYEGPQLRADLGVTPIGFAVVRPMGGLRHRGDLGSFSYSLELSSRPVTSSVLSYAGARDPRTGTVWGGVQASGARLALSRDEGGAFGAWAALGLHRLTGRNVLANDRVQAMAGTYWRIISGSDRLLSVGVTAMAWRYSENAGEFTFGHGGYFSPHSYRSIGLPITFGERRARFSYTVRGAVTASRSVVQGAPFFPTDGAMQSDAQARTAATGIDPNYEASRGGGRGYTLAAAMEYQLAPRLFIGSRLEIERSRNFEPNRVLIYARLTLDRVAARPVSFPPEPFLPTAEH
ncbi:MAG: cellulose synthase subunit BcsC-related outer membrane protein [Burkholderiales bacterium]